MVNSGYTPRHSAAPALKVVRRPRRVIEPAVAGQERRRSNRAQVAIISATALALVAFVTYFGTRAEPDTVSACTGANCANTANGGTVSGPPSGLPAVRVYRGGRYALRGPSAVLVGAGVWVTNVLGDSVTRIPPGHGKALTLAAGYGFDGPNALAIGNGHVWVANVPANSIIELNQSTGALVREFSTGYGLASPYALLIHGKHLWVANAASNAVTEINVVTGRLVRIRSAAADGFDNPSALAVSGGRLWVANSGGNSLTVLNASTGRWITTLKAGFHFNDPTALATSGARVWVASTAGDTLTQIDAATHKVVRVLSGPQFGLRNPSALAVADGILWVANSLGNSVTEINASTGALIRVLSGREYHFKDPSGIAASGKIAWVTNMGGNSVTRLTVP
jgi:DNA-binding beta-propeller fold protein YncE